MFNIAISLGIWLLVSLISIPTGIVAWFTIPFGLIIGFVFFVWQGRKVGEAINLIASQAGREAQEGKFDRAIALLQTGFAFEKRHIFVGPQLHSQIGMLYYYKKDHDNALEHLEKGFWSPALGHCMKAAIYFKRKEFDKVAKTMAYAIKRNNKDPFAYGLAAWFHVQQKDEQAAIKVLQDGLKKLPNDQRLQTNLVNLQNAKKLKMKLFGDIWLQMMLEKPPKIVQQPTAPHLRVSRRDMFR